MLACIMSLPPVPVIRTERLPHAWPKARAAANATIGGSYVTGDWAVGLMFA
jgi:hypothetical protein